MAPVTRQPTSPIANSTDLFSWKNYFLTCWAAIHHNNVSRYLPSSWIPFFRVLVMYKIRFGRLLERCIYPNRKHKALLIGIKKAKDEDTLTRPHEDVYAMRDLLINVYGYRTTDITIMLDDGVLEDANMLPTHKNILRAIGDLVRDAQAGDRFVFHFSGHSTQVKNVTGTEDDGMDEAIIPVDSEEIIDNVLRNKLVDPLPVGSSLVAIFDTCHSASLLDLSHHRCNRLTRPGEGVPIQGNNAEPQMRVPWTPVQARMSIYQHTPTSPLAPQRGRRNSVYHQHMPSPSVPSAPTLAPPPPAKPVRRATSPFPGSAIRTPAPAPAPTPTPTPTPRNIPIRKRTLSRKTTIQIRAPTLKLATRVTIKTGSSSPGATPQMERFREFGSPITAVRRSTGPAPGMEAVMEDRQVDKTEKQVRWLEDDGQDRRAMSPERYTPPVVCDGGKLCEAARAEADAYLANVIALGACKDGQTTWEDQDAGKTMTAVLVEHLSNNPLMPLEDLMRKISEETYNNINKMHRDWENYKKRAPTDAAKQPDFSQEWQDPQLAGHWKLDMSMPFLM